MLPRISCMQPVPLNGERFGLRRVLAVAGPAIQRDYVQLLYFRDEEFLLFHHLFKYEIFVMKRQSAYGTVGIAVGPVEKLDDPEAAFVYVEMDIPLFKIRCDQAPDFCPGVSPLYLLPDLESEFIYDRNREYVFHVIVKPAVFLFSQVPECNVCHICSFKECRWYPDCPVA